MGRLSKLSDLQWHTLHDRLVQGESASALGREYGVSESAIRKRFGSVKSISEQSAKVREVAQILADASDALQELPPAQRPAAISLSEMLRSMSRSLAHAGDLGAKTAHRLQALANSEVAKVDDADPLQSLDALRGVGALTKLANDSAAIALNLIAANKETVVKINTDQTKPAAIPAKRLSTEALREIVAARNAG